MLCLSARRGSGRCAIASGAGDAVRAASREDGAVGRALCGDGHDLAIDAPGSRASCAWTRAGVETLSAAWRFASTSKQAGFGVSRAGELDGRPLH